LNLQKDGSSQTQKLFPEIAVSHPPTPSSLQMLSEQLFCNKRSTCCKDKKMGEGSSD
jgi:hypothetical protein